MRLSEVFLRIGSALAAWMILYTYFIWLAVAGRTGCGADGDEIFRLLLGVAPFAIAAAFVIRSTGPFRDIHRILRWFGVPLAGLLCLTLPVICNVFAQVNLGGIAICADAERTMWQASWAPMQLITTAICIWQIVTVWRFAKDESN